MLVEEPHRSQQSWFDVYEKKEARRLILKLIEVEGGREDVLQLVVLPPLVENQNVRFRAKKVARLPPTKKEVVICDAALVDMYVERTSCTNIY